MKISHSTVKEIENHDKILTKGIINSTSVTQERAHYLSLFSSGKESGTRSKRGNFTEFDNMKKMIEMVIRNERVGSQGKVHYNKWDHSNNLSYESSINVRIKSNHLKRFEDLKKQLDAGSTRAQDRFTGWYLPISLLYFDGSFLPSELFNRRAASSKVSVL